MAVLDEEDENLAHFLESEVLSQVSDQVINDIFLSFRSKLGILYMYIAGRGGGRGPGAPAQPKEKASGG